jgi:hypothetical protein
MRHREALDQLARETKRAGRALALERAALAGFWLVFAVIAWTAIALAGAHERLPLLAQSLTALTALLLFAWLALRAQRRWRAPTEAEARARLAEDSKLEFSAFEALRDQPTRYDAISMALWRKEQDQAVARAERARARGLRLRFDTVDKFRLRYLLAAALLGAIVLAFSGDPGDRLARAFMPDPGPLLGDREMVVEAWLTPAEYTHAAPISLSDVLGQRIEAPPESEAMVRVTGPVGAPVLVFDGAGATQRVRFTRAADGAWEARMPIARTGRLKIVRFHTRAHWRIAPIADAAPQASFAAPITLLPNERAMISWRASDDFGLRRLVLRARPLDPPQGLLRADPVDVELETPAGDPREAEAQVEVELADHPYAGMEVEARIVAIDANGQEGASDPLHVNLPEKVFLQPLARAAIEIRRNILTDRRPYRGEARQARRTMPAGDIVLGNQRIELRDFDRRPALQRAPEGVRRAARLADALTIAPQDGYFRDLAVFVGLRLARAQLDVAREIAETELAADTLWRTALRAEYGGAADARRALEEAQRQLAEALQNGAPPERIQQLFEALRQATERYMQALVQEALRNGETSNAEDTQQQTEISGAEIEEMLREAQRLSEQGRTQEAQQLLNMLANILQNMDVQLAESQGEGGEGEQDQQMQESMDQLSQAMGEQRSLNNETQEQQREQQSGQGSGGSQQGGQGGDELARQQADIRQGLAEAQQMADEAGAAPSEDLNAAGEAMRRAENALRRGDFEGASAAQAAALDRLREGADALAAEMRARGREGRQAQGEGGQGGARDPLGRSVGEDGQTSVPTAADPVRAREIMDDILERAQDPNRPEAEREYLRRLLERFSDS